MKLIVDARYTRIGFHDGISRYTTSLLAALQELQITENFQLAMAISDDRQLDMLPAGIPHVKICSPTGPFEPFAALQLNRYQPDVVFSPMQTMGSWGRKFKLMLTLHDLIYYSHPAPPGFLPKPVQWGWRLFHKTYLPQRVLLNRADAVATVSETTASLIREKKLTHRSLHVIPNAAQPGSIIDSNRAHTLTNHRNKDLIYMGSFMPYKNVETLIEAMQYLPGYTLRLLSKISDQKRTDLKTIIKGSVVFENGVSEEEYERFLENSAALLTASREEGYGLPVVEAQAHGCPVVISDIPIFREIAPHALFCSPDSPEEFAHAILSLEEKTQQEKVIEDGLKDATAYSWKKSARRLLSVLQQL